MDDKTNNQNNEQLNDYQVEGSNVASSSQFDSKGNLTNPKPVSNLEKEKEKEKSIRRWEDYIFMLVITLIFLSIFIFAIPNPVRDSVYKMKDKNVATRQQKDYYGLPKICEILDSTTAQLIIGDKILPSMETSPSTSVIVCTYSNITRDKGVSFIARKYNSSSSAATYFESTKDGFNFETVNGSKVKFNSQTDLFELLKEDYVYTMQYVGIETVDLVKMKQDASLIISKI